MGIKYGNIARDPSTVHLMGRRLLVLHLSRSLSSRLMLLVILLLGSAVIYTILLLVLLRLVLLRLVLLSVCRVGTIHASCLSLSSYCPLRLHRAHRTANYLYLSERERRGSGSSRLIASSLVQTLY